MKRLGVLYFNVGRYEEAISILDESLALCAHHAYGPQHHLEAEVLCALSDIHEVDIEEHFESIGKAYHYNIYSSTD